MQTTARQVLSHLASQRQQMATMLRSLVEHESPSDDKSSCDALALALAQQFSSIGGRTKIHAAKHAGDHLQVDFEGRSGKPILIVGHYDTVYDIGTLQTMPYRETRDRICGPGVLDMKGGIVQIYFALEALQSQGGLPRPVTVILVSDEEVGSQSSRPITERLARRSAAALVCEPAAGERGALKTARKGVGDYLVRVRGVASHAGLDFQKGQSAVVELAHQIRTIADFTNLKRGLTVNPGVIRGGTRSNVVADSAEAEIDVRIVKKKDAELVARMFSRLRPANRKCQLTVTGGVNRPPMERSGGTAELFRKAQSVSAELGFKVYEMAVGGGSDGNFTSAIVPTLDGLGAVGDGAHAKHEFILVAELPRRAALLAGLIRSI
jgi:glutamate carboxypeptidase